MHEPLFPDLYDWRGCEAVRFNPEKLGGRATVLEFRLDADTVYINAQDRMTVEDLFDSYGSDMDAIRTILKFARDHNLQPRPQAITGHLKVADHQIEIVISPWAAGHAVHIAHRNGATWEEMDAGIWATVEMAKQIAQEKVTVPLPSGSTIMWRGDGS